ncbi:MAG: metal-dependent hydrolase, partial [Alteromonadales bacterium]|nr:metal-dependent hydrolase [Alteromonadales bacterium]
MSPGTHLLFSWLSTAEILKNRRERAIVSLSGIAPDIDGAGIIVDEITGTTDLYFQYHHYLGHS